jgi:hypothetical protein
MVTQLHMYIFIFIYGLFSDTVSSLDCKAVNDGMIMNWKGTGKKVS